MLSGFETLRFSRMLDWSLRDRSLLLCLLTMPLFLIYAVWGWLSLRFTPFGLEYLDAEGTLEAVRISLVTVLLWAGMSIWGGLLRRHQRESMLYLNVTLFAYGLCQLPVGYYVGLAAPITGIVMLGSTLTGFILFSFWRVLIAFFVTLALLLVISILIVLDVLPYAPMFKADPILRGNISGYFVISQFLLGIPFVATTFVLTYMLLTRWQRREQQAQRLAVTDALTGVANRRAITESLAQEFARARRRGEEMAVIMLDLDFFKRVNDQYGHAAGDDVLRLAASVLRQSVREVDRVGRLGGEEFMVLLPGADADAAMAVAERCREHIASAVTDVGAGQVLTVTASLGVFAAQASAVTAPERYMALADDALYQAKAAGRNRVVQYRDAGTGAPSPG